MKIGLDHCSLVKHVIEQKAYTVHSHWSIVSNRMGLLGKWIGRRLDNELCIETAITPRINIMYSTSPSSNNTLWNNSTKHVASIAFPCWKLFEGALIAVLRDVIAFTRWPSAVVESCEVLSCVTVEPLAKSDAESASIA